MHFDKNLTTLADIDQFVESLQCQQFTYQDVMDCWADHFRNKYGAEIDTRKRTVPTISITAVKQLDNESSEEELDIDSDDEIVVPKKPSNKNRQQISNNNQILARKWTNEELQLLLKGVEKYGNRWVAIYKENKTFWDLHDRNPKKLRRKYCSYEKH